MRFVVTVAVAAVAGCATAPDSASQGAKAVVLSSQQIAAVHDGLRSRLKDPESARFGPLTGSRNAKGYTVVCGWVNARNSFGGYTGQKPYVGHLAEIETGHAKKPIIRSFGVIGIGGEWSASAAVELMCRQEGAALPPI